MLLLLFDLKEAKLAWRAARAEQTHRDAEEAKPAAIGTFPEIITIIPVS